MTKARTLRELATATGVVFGTSGVRGRVSDLTPEVCHAYTYAFLSHVRPQRRTLIIGHDLRPSSPGIAAICCQSARQSGWTVINAGVLPTPALAYAAQQLGFPALMVTGSHIPFDRNGLKFYHAHGEITKADEADILASSLPAFPLETVEELPGADPSVLGMYIRRYLDCFSPTALSGLRIGVFEHSSVARDLLHLILRSLGAETVSLGRTDEFIAVDTEAVRKEDIEIAPVWAASHELDAIVTTDGDADRPLVADEHGVWIRGDILGLICARELGARSVVTPISSNSALELSGLFRSIIRTKIGSPHVIAAIDICDDHPVAGYEANGGFLLGSTTSFGAATLKALKTRDAILPILLVLEAAHRRRCSLSGLLVDLPARHTASDRLQNVDINACGRFLASIEADTDRLSTLLAPDSGHVNKIDKTDGLRVAFANGDIVHLRLSGNAPELRCYAEASRAERANQLRNDCLEKIRSLIT